MSGTINSTQAVPQGQSGLANPLLRQTEQGIEARLKPEMQQNYTKIVVAGMHIALQNGANSFMAKLNSQPDPIGACAKAAVALVLIMKKQSKGVMPTQAMIPAGMSLMLHGLDYIDHAGIAKIRETELARATTVFTNELFHRVGITPQMLHSATARVHQIVQDPDAMAKINLKAGLTRHPQAAVPSNIPGMPSPAMAAA